MPLTTWSRTNQKMDFSRFRLKVNLIKVQARWFFLKLRSIVNSDSIAKLYLLTIEYAIQIMFKCARTNHKDSVAVVFLDFLKVLRFPVPVPVEGTLKILSSTCRQVYSFPQHCAIISLGPSRLTLTDLATGRERQLTTGKSAERTEYDLRCPICRSATGQAIS